MALVKIRKLRAMEFTFTDDDVHSSCHLVYHDVVEEDGVEIAKTIAREVGRTTTERTDLSTRDIYVPPNSP